LGGIFILAYENKESNYMLVEKMLVKKNMCFGQITKMETPAMVHRECTINNQENIF